MNWACFPWHKFLNYTCKAHFGPLPSDLAYNVQSCCEEFVKGSCFLGFFFFFLCLCFLRRDTRAHTTETRLRLNLDANFEFSFSLQRQETVVDTKSHFASFLFRYFNQDSVSGSRDFFKIANRVGINPDWSINLLFFVSHYMKTHSGFSSHSKPKVQSHVFLPETRQNRVILCTKRQIATSQECPATDNDGNSSLIFR